MKALKALETQGLVLYFHHSTQSFGDSLYDNTFRVEALGCLYMREKDT